MSFGQWLVWALNGTNMNSFWFIRMVLLCGRQSHTLITAVWKPMGDVTLQPLSLTTHNNFLLIPTWSCTFYHFFQPFLYQKWSVCCATANNIQMCHSYLGYIFAQDTAGMCIEGRILPSSWRPLVHGPLGPSLLWAFSHGPSGFQSDSSPLDSSLFLECFDFLSVYRLKLLD